MAIRRSDVTSAKLQFGRDTCRLDGKPEANSAKTLRFLQVRRLPAQLDGRTMPDPRTTPFDSIESAHEYVGLLCEALDDAERMIEHEIANPCAFTGHRHLDALRLVDYKLKTLRQHFVASRRLLTDLRTLRRYLLDERSPEQTTGQTPADSTSSDPFRVAAP